MRFRDLQVAKLGSTKGEEWASDQGTEAELEQE